MLIQLYHTKGITFWQEPRNENDGENKKENYQDKTRQDALPKVLA